MKDRPIRLGVNGAGWIGSGFVTQVERMPGMEVVALADPSIDRARRVFQDLGYDQSAIAVVETRREAMEAIEKGKKVVTESLSLLSEIDWVDVVVDATSSPLSGAIVAYHGIRNGKIVVLVNIEADATVGRALRRLAEKEDVLYTVSSGDEPGCLMELFQFVQALRFEPIVLGKGKNNPLDPHATPDTVREHAMKQKKDPFQVASYVDGTKTMFEMCCCANATGFAPAKRGMLGPRAELDTVSQVFALQEDGGLTPFPGIVDFVRSQSMAGGVFVVVRVDHERIREDLEYLKVGKGKYFTFFRPYHLWFLEAPLSVLRACRYREPTLVPLDRPVAEVIAVAKKDLRAGEVLDDFGGFTFYGVLDRADVAHSLRALPAGLAPGARVKRDFKRDSVITWDDVELEETLLLGLRLMQDEKDWGVESS
jgi:predicted homoserine dehydrogenase-like protein